MASTRPPPPNAKRPKYIGNYEVKRVIGEGSFGKVKLGVHVLTGEKVAIKVGGMCLRGFDLRCRAVSRSGIWRRRLC